MRQTCPRDGDAELERELHARLVPPVAIIAVGSDLRGDDAFGIEVGRGLKAGDLPEDVVVLEGGTAPENLAERVASASPLTVLVLDAAEFGGSPGELRLLDPGELGWGHVGTHAPSLELLSSYLEMRCGARMPLLACQPGRTGFASAMHEEVRAAARYAAELIRRALAAAYDRFPGQDAP